MRSNLKLGKTFTRQTAACQERAIKALETAEPPLARCVVSWGACSFLARALANTKRLDDIDEDKSAQVSQERVRGAACGGMPQRADVLLGGGGGSWALVFLVVEIVTGRLAQAASGDSTVTEGGRRRVRGGRKDTAGRQDPAGSGVQRHLDMLPELDQEQYMRTMVRVQKMRHARSL